MSAQFGRWNLNGMPVDEHYLDRAKGIIKPHGPDAEASYLKHNIGLAYCAFHTTKESRGEVQPHVLESGALIMWDGRLDNRSELIDSLGNGLTSRSPDLSIVAAAFERWGSGCFSRMIGDWALSICKPETRCLILAKDPIGTRHLYYSLDRDSMTWSTVLDPLVLLSERSFRLEQEYIAGWLSFFPAAHLTPFAGIHSVPPACFVLLREGRCSIEKYWDFDPGRRIVYRNDGEYEEHFRSVFGQAVRRRLRSGDPIIAELSGGMDSSSIVCMADEIIRRPEAATPRLDTLSYYDDAEPNWNERPYFTRVEEKRGKTGSHIDVGRQEPFDFEFDGQAFAATPGSGGRPSEATELFSACLRSNGNRVVLSGIGGDEILGGVPTPIPELENLLARAELRTLAHQLKVWALEKRRPWFHLFLEAARGFLPPALIRVSEHRRPAPWLSPEFVRRNRKALQGYECRLKLFGALPSFQECLNTLDALRRQMACSAMSIDPPYEKRYPYLDRSLLEFIYAIPRGQLVRPGQRRSLMRRALVGIVPDEVLHRRRKAFVARKPLAGISANWLAATYFSSQMQSSALGIVDANRFKEFLQRARQGQEVSSVFLTRTIAIELWLRNLSCTHAKQQLDLKSAEQRQIFARRQMKFTIS